METVTVKHTSGPWRTSGTATYSQSGLKVASCTYDGGLANRHGIKNATAIPLSSEEAHANARLIAAAPELLEACSRVEEILQNAASGHGIQNTIRVDVRWLISMAAKLRDAIAKAVPPRGAEE